MSDSDGYIAGLLCFALMIGSFMMGMSCMKNGMRRDAVAAGVAEWVTNKETGEAKFQYKRLMEKTP